MSKIFVVRYTAKPEVADENQRLVEAVFAELAKAQPEGYRYATFRLEDGTFVHISMNEEEESPLGQLKAFEELGRFGNERWEAPPNVQLAQLVGSYRVLSND